MTTSTPSQHKVSALARLFDKQVSFKKKKHTKPKQRPTVNYTNILKVNQSLSVIDEQESNEDDHQLLYWFADENCTSSESNSESESDYDVAHDINIEDIAVMGALSLTSYKTYTYDDAPNDLFIQNREQQISIDLMDMLATSSESDTDDNVVIGDLLVMFGLFQTVDVNVYEYFHKLNICYENELLHVLPQTITNYDNYNQIGIKQLKKINKMVKYVSHKINNDDMTYHGKYKKEWIQLEYNKIYKIYQYKSSLLLNYEEICREEINYKDMIYLMGNTYYNKLIKLNELGEKVIELKLHGLPELCPGEAELLQFGIQFNSIIVYTDDRMCIRNNETYISNISYGTFIENGSIIKIKITPFADGIDVNFMNEKNNVCVNIKNMNETFFNIFIKQWAGKGEYILNIL